jgi:hypothetical protein
VTEGDALATARKHWFRVADSVLRKPWSNDQLATLVRLMAYLNGRWAREGISSEDAGHAVISITDAMAITGKHRTDIARKSLECLADIASMSVQHRGDVVVILWHNYAEFQGMTSLKMPPPPPPPPPPPHTPIRRKNKSAATASPRASARSHFPDPLPEGFREKILRSVSNGHNLTAPQVDFAIASVRDWALAGGHKKSDWVATVRGAIARGWGLEGYSGPRKSALFPEDE